MYNKYSKYKSKYLRLKLLNMKGGNLNCDILNSDIRNELNPDIKNNYNTLLFNKVIICNNNKILIKNYEDKEPEYVPIIWDKLKKLFKSGAENSVNIIKGIGGLRKIIITYMLNKEFNIHKPCYIEFGSTNPTSDLDFTYVTYSNPSSVLDLMIKFYTKFYETFMNFPDVTFDTNFYICSTYISIDCFALVTVPNISELFIKDDKYMKMYNFSNDIYRDIDRNICFYIQKKFINSLSKSTDEKYTKMSKLIKFSKVFYDILENITKVDMNKDNLLKLLRTIYFFMTSSSNESYISDATYSSVVLTKTLTNLKDKYLAYIDNYIYIYEWYLFYKDSNKSIEYFDIVSKYIERCAYFIKDTKYKLPEKIVKDSIFWKKNIRGQIPIQNIKDKNISTYNKQIIEEGHKIYTSILVIEDIFNIFKEVYNNIQSEFGDNINNKYVDTIETIINKIIVNINTNGNVSININNYNFNEVLKTLKDLLI